MGDTCGRSARVQQLAKFALSDSLRNNVGNSLRKRNKSECDVESGPPIVEKGSRGRDQRVAVKVRSTKAKRSVRLSKRAPAVQPQGASQLRSIALKNEEVEASGFGGGYERLDASFYECDALELAPKLLGKLIRRDDVILRITEVEAYRPGDSACHGRVGQTARTAPLPRPMFAQLALSLCAGKFGPAGHAYVYLCYGLHIMLNVVADSVGVGAAVLIRACSPVSGLNSIHRRRGQSSEKPVLLTGPGKVGQALGLTTEWSSHPLYTPGGLEILNAPLPTNILVGPRVGINYAEPKDVAALWRFAVADSPWISPPRQSLSPLQLLEPSCKSL